MAAGPHAVAETERCAHHNQGGGADIRLLVFFFFNFLISGPPPEVVTHSRRGTLPQLTFSRSTIKDPDEYLSADFISNEVGNHYKLL